MSNAYNEGYTARQNEIDITECPYAKDTRDYDSWRQGWYDSEACILEAGDEEES